MSSFPWDSSDDPDALLSEVWPHLTERSSRLVAVGLLRTIDHLIRTTQTRTLLARLDEFAAGAITRHQLESFQYALGPTDDGRAGRLLWRCGFVRRARREEEELVNLKYVSQEVALMSASDAAGPYPADVRPGSPWHVAFQDAWRAARAASADVIRCAIPNPARGVPFDAAWKTSTAVAIAAQARTTGDFGAMPILADALEDAGCSDEDLLTHLRGQGRHHACCWGARVVLGD